MKINNVMVLIADGVPDRDGEIISLCEIPTTPIPVRTVTGDSVGVATLKKHGSNLLADIDLIISAPGKKLYPAVAGRVDSRQETSAGISLSCTVDSLLISEDGNVDERIPPITLSDAE